MIYIYRFMVPVSKYVRMLWSDWEYLDNKILN